MKVLVTIPVWDGYIRQELVEVLMEYMVDKRYEKTICFVKGRPLEEALNICAHLMKGGGVDRPDRVKVAYSDFDDFEREDFKGYDYWLSIDADNIPTRNFLDLIEDDKDAVFLPYPIAQAYSLDENPLRWGVKCEEKERKGYQKIECGASGSMLIARRVIDALPQPTFKRVYSEEDGTVTRGVDYKFCDDIHAAGFQCWVKWEYISNHYNEVELVAMIVGHSNHYKRLYNQK